MVKLRRIDENLDNRDLDKYIKDLSSEFRDVLIIKNRDTELSITVVYKGISENLYFSSDDTEDEVSNTIRLFINNLKSLLKANEYIKCVHSTFINLLRRNFYYSKRKQEINILWDCSGLETFPSFCLSVPYYKFSITFYYYDKSITSYLYNTLEGVYFRIEDKLYKYTHFNIFLKEVIDKLGFSKYKLKDIYFQHDASRNPTG